MIEGKERKILMEFGKKCMSLRLTPIKGVPIYWLNKCHKECWNWLIYKWKWNASKNNNNNNNNNKIMLKTLKNWEHKLG
jgi:hypothetical protein